MSPNDDDFLRPGAISEPGSPNREVIPPPDCSEVPPPALPEVAPIIAASLAAFRRALPELLKRRRGQFVSYHGEECLGFSHSSFDLYDEGFRRGLKDDEFIVERVIPDFPPDAEITVPYEV